MKQQEIESIYKQAISELEKKEKDLRWYGENVYSKKISQAIAMLKD